MAGRKPLVPGRVLTPKEKQQRYRDARAYKDLVTRQFFTHLERLGIEPTQFMLDSMSGRLNIQRLIS